MRDDITGTCNNFKKSKQGMEEEKIIMIREKERK
jgi:hypothetical protein